jgi:aspartate racemase
MKTAGMIGGLGPESTIDYYRLIIARYRGRDGDGSYPSLIINSLDVSKAIRLVDSGRLGELADYLAAGVESLARAGADFSFMSANTPHIVFDEVQRRSAIPLLSIVRTARQRVQSLGLTKVGLLGTRFTMQADFYPQEFQGANIALIRPSASEQEFIHDKYMHELLVGAFLPETRAEMLRIAQRMTAEDGAQAIILAGTELPLLLRGSESPELAFLDTTEIHVEAIVDELLR